ncbi:6230_t:CDS:2 [Paraglomus occultum]|uniref:6230_t:CDS:1 n=1 Tax=Paraglomus occultum TaxID=144539 RepID=A0A9N9DH26_9GLOM|nr:6230_t:CDS:2 [Paraglomus occultum]
METLFKSIRDRVQQRNIKVLAKKCDQTPSTLPTTFQNPAIASLILKATSKHIDMPALVIQWNPAGFNNDPASPNNRNGVVGQNQDAVINSLQMAGAINYGNTIFMFRDSMQDSVTSSNPFLFAKGSVINLEFLMSL